MDCSSNCSLTWEPGKSSSEIFSTFYICKHFVIKRSMKWNTGVTIVLLYFYRGKQRMGRHHGKGLVTPFSSQYTRFPFYRAANIMHENSFSLFSSRVLMCLQFSLVPSDLISNANLTLRLIKKLDIISFLFF